MPACQYKTGDDMQNLPDNMRPRQLRVLQPVLVSGRMDFGAGAGGGGGRGAVPGGGGERDPVQCGDTASWGDCSFLQRMEMQTQQWKV